MGTPVSAGTKLLSVSGDCDRPGIYEVEWGLTLNGLLNLVGAKDTLAVQVGGASGQCLSEAGFGRKLCYSDLATGGSIIISIKPGIFSLLSGISFDFFIEESCGWCTPCRAGNVLIKNKFEKIVSGLGTASDLAEIEPGEINQSH